ncbi:MAG: hypothetical protein AAGH46_06705 [Bacteroidota bacterium]
MKHLRLSLLLILCTFMFTCDEEDLLDFLEDPEIDVTTNFAFLIDISSPMLSNPDERVSFTSGILAYDIISNPEIAERIGEPERIKGVRINTVTYEFKNFSGNVDADVSGFLAFPGPVGGEGDIRYDMQEVKVAEADLFGNVYTLNGNFGAVNERASELKGIGCVYTGDSSHNPVDFTLEVIVNATITLEINIDDL